MLRALGRSRTTAVILLAALSLGGLLAALRALGLPLLPVGVGLVCGGGIGAVVLSWLRRRRDDDGLGARARRRPGHPGVPGRSYDLAKDKTTDSQRWLM